MYLARKKETRLQKQPPNRSQADIDAYDDHEHFAAVIDDLVVMFTNAIRNLYPLTTSFEKMTLSDKAVPTSTYAAISDPNRDSDSEDDGAPRSQREKTPPKEGHVKSRLTKTQRKRIVTQAAIDGIGDDCWKTFGKQTVAVKTMAADFVDRSFDASVTLITRSLVLNVAYHFIEKLTAKFTLIHVDPVTEPNPNKGQPAASFLKLHREHYLEEKKGAGPAKLFEIAAAHSMPVLAKFLDLEAGQLGTLDRSCFQGSSDLPRYGANLPNDDGSISRLRSTREVDIGTYVPRWVAKASLTFLRQLDHLSTDTDCDPDSAFRSATGSPSPSASVPQR